MKNKALNAAVIRNILALLLMGALLLTSFISVNALEWNGDSSTGSMIGRPAVSNSFYVLDGTDDISQILVAWRFTYYDKYGNLKYAGEAGDGVTSIFPDHCTQQTPAQTGDCGAILPLAPARRAIPTTT